MTISTGCALTPAAPGPAPSRRPPEIVSPQGRSDELLHDFEERRDKAQLGAALSRWKQGDVAGSESLLVQLLERNADNREARRALADLYVSKSDSAAALEHLWYLVEHDPADPQCHHSLGLLFESLGRQDEALRHFEEAVRLDPQNELYLLTRDACREGDKVTDKVTR